ncbi:hypothetical protein CYLTODRAFT_166888 [Cylindrobasidium torrendii FP15055 ss-10]|uniref:Defective in cullin neddylation protein n=1 Tax=Cylindrobasidium torrendii FP15055 ss-10 TaxID=1314674 RepID=A0A0D7AWH4_9AGAR|nr:hypothetical protein CYLTODRAFT_166888 [Cylindrobasidium torrendii FP15055 ss-10]
MGLLFSVLSSCFRRKDSSRASSTTNGETSKSADPPAEPKPEPKKVTLSKKHEPYSPKAAAALFATYADADNSALIGPEGFDRMCTDADISMDGALPVLLSWQLKSEEMGKFELEKWEKWTTTHKCTCIEELDDLLFQGKPPVKPSKKPDEPYDRTTYFQYAAAPKEAFQSLYAFCFVFTKPPASRNIDMDTARAFWTLLLVPKYILMSEILEFISAHEDSYKAVNKDLWSMMLEFLEAVGPNLDGYDEEAAWPTLVDEFVASKKGQD